MKLHTSMEACVPTHSYFLSSVMLFIQPGCEKKLCIDGWSFMAKQSLERKTEWKSTDNYIEIENTMDGLALYFHETLWIHQSYLSLAQYGLKI